MWLVSSIFRNFQVNCWNISKVSQPEEAQKLCFEVPLTFAPFHLFIWLHWILRAACGIFSCGIWDLAPQPRIQLRPPALGAQSLSHWVTREIPLAPFYNVLYLFGLCWVFIAARLFCSCGEWERLFVAVRGFSSRWLWFQSMGSRHSGCIRCSSWALEHRLNSCGTQAWLLRGMWDLPGPGIEPVYPALAGVCFTTELAGKSLFAPF